MDTEEVALFTNAKTGGVVTLKVTVAGDETNPAESVTV
jgi:hypothetical protein